MGSQFTPLLTTITTLLPPGPSLSAWDGTLAPSQQSSSTHSSVPRTFLDAMTVREAVFVREQQIPAENEFDANDPRSVHFVIYSSSSSSTSGSDNNNEDDDETQRSLPVSMPMPMPKPKPKPIGTVRIVPFPHAPHPVKGGRYLADELVNHGELDAETVQALEMVEQGNGGKDRKTKFHDGEEPYLKLGRLAVLPEFRGQGVAGRLIQKAVEWMGEHPGYFTPEGKEKGSEGKEKGLMKWNGLFCVHAQVTAIKVWKRAGFVIDEEMGRWWEEGIEHVGMWRRVEVKKVVVRSR